MKVLNYLQFKLQHHHQETNDQPSLTVPDQALTVREIMDRFTNGQTITRSNNLVYTGDADLPDLRQLDLVEIDDLRRSTEQDIASADKSIKAMKTKLKKDEAAKKIKADDNSSHGDGEA